jgi:hypothetical protein
MQAVDVEVGTTPVDQFAAVFHSPDAAAFQLSVHGIAGRTWATDLSSAGDTIGAAPRDTSLPTRWTGWVV